MKSERTHAPAFGSMKRWCFAQPQPHRLVTATGEKMSKQRAQKALSRIRARMQLYNRAMWMLLIAFGMTGTLAGHLVGGMYVMVVAALGWSATRIVVEGVEALGMLHLLNKQEEQQRRPSDSDPPPPTATSPVT